MPEMSQRAYARHRGSALSSVQKAIKSGRISTLPSGQIDSDIADADWANNTQTQAPPVSRAGPTKASPPSIDRERAVLRSSNKTKQTDDDADSFGASQYTKARAVREHFQARMAKLEYEARTAKLVSGEEVQVAAFNKFRQFRDGMLNIPDRLAAMLAAETVASTVHALLTDEIRKALNDFADQSNS